MFLKKELNDTKSFEWLNKKTIAFIGDSITAEIKTNYVTLVINKIADYFDVSKLKIANSGIDSSSIVDALDRLPEFLIDHDPDVVTIFLGINDSKIFHYIHTPLIHVDYFKERYLTLINRLDYLRIRKKILVNLPALMFDEISKGKLLKNYWSWDPEVFDKYNLAIKEISKEKNCLLADVNTAFKKVSNKRLFYDDGVHPNINGHRIISDEIFGCLGKLND